MGLSYLTWDGDVKIRLSSNSVSVTSCRSRARLGNKSRCCGMHVIMCVGELRNRNIVPSVYQL